MENVLASRYIEYLHYLLCCHLFIKCDIFSKVDNFRSQSNIMDRGERICEFIGYRNHDEYLHVNLHFCCIRV